MKWTEELKVKIIEALVNKPVGPCNRCAFGGFDMVNGFFVQMVSDDTEVMPYSQLAVTAIPSVVTVCQKCGALSQHAIGALGINLEAVNRNQFVGVPQ